MITKAIIPVAGWGIRRLPITKAIEKCMLPIGNRPLVDYVVQDCIQAGITEIYFIVTSESTQLKQYYSDNNTLNEYLAQNNKTDQLGLVTPPQNITFHYIEQPKDGKYGTAIPVALAAASISEDESVVVLMGDDFIYNQDGSSEVQRLINATHTGMVSLLGATVSKDQTSQYGVLEVSQDNEFIRIVEKPNPEEAPSTLINTSKYVLTYDVVQRIVNFVNAEQPGEYYITDPLNQYVAEGGVVQVVEAVGEYLDGGSLDGWWHANQVVLGKRT